ncbi:M56 family metallopeptidase [Cellulomonas iranensis]|uniref:M56 family metallopeptidase n=1 Tax=Cellulomonas iranensis TaxID=76862 RepID=UPI003D7C7038
MTAFAVWLAAMTAVTAAALLADRRWSARLRPTVLAGAWFALAVAWLVPFRPARHVPATAFPLDPTATVPTGAPPTAFAPSGPGLPGVGWAVPGAGTLLDRVGTAGAARAALTVLGLAWAAGAVVALVRAVVARHAMRTHVARWGVEVDPALVRDLLGADVGGPTPRVVVAPVPAPVVLGLRAPRVVLPVIDTDTPLVLRHEVAHLRRRDPAQRAVLVLVRAVHWWNPVVRRAVDAAVRSSEVACDAAATAHLGRAGRVRYARALLHAHPAAPAPGRPLVPALTEGHDVARRITTLFEDRPRGRGIGVLALGAALVVGVGVPVWAGTGGGATPPGCVPGSVVEEDGARACELVDDPAVAAPAGWSSENATSLVPGDGVDLGLQPWLGADLTVDDHGTVRYRGEAVRGFVGARADGAQSTWWDDEGDVYVLADTAGRLREVAAQDFPFDAS